MGYQAVIRAITVHCGTIYGTSGTNIQLGSYCHTLKGRGGVERERERDRERDRQREHGDEEEEISWGLVIWGDVGFIAFVWISGSESHLGLLQG